MKTQLSLLVLSLALLNGCGNDKDDRKETGVEKNPTEEGTDGADGSGASLADDEEAAGQTVTAEIDDAISSAVEENESDAGASLADAGADGKLTWFRECKEDGANAVVDIRREAERTLSVEGPLRKLDSSFSAYYEKTRTWSKEGAEIKCHAGKKFAELPLADMAGVKLDAKVKHERNRAMTLTNKKKNETVTKAFHFVAEGERHVTWKEVTEEGDSYLVHKEATASGTRKLEITKKDGTTKVLEGSAQTIDGQPLVITVERDKATLAWVSRTIVSGGRVATNKEGGKVELTFDNVKYTTEKRCTAVSGKISGKIYKKDETTASVTFEITFDGDSKTVTMSNGKEFDYSPEGCDLDEPSKAVDAESKDEVKPAEAA